MSKKFLSILLSAAVVCSALPAVTAFADGEAGNKTTGNSVSYVAIGDSIPNGYALADPQAGFVNRLGAKEGVNATNLSVSGLLSDVMKGAVLSGAYDTVLTNAQYMTITIGGNDLLGVFYTIVVNKFNADYGVTLGQITADDVKNMLGAPNPTDPKTQALFLSVSAVIDQGYGSYAALLGAGFNKVISNINTSIAAIRSKNPAVKIYVTNQYNPYPSLQIPNLVTGTPSSLGAFMDDILTAYNAMLTTEATGADEVVDVYTPFAGSQNRPVNSALDLSNFDVHPNVIGHGIYFDALDGLIHAEEEKPEGPVISTGGGFTYQISSGAYKTVTCSGALPELTGIYIDNASVAADKHYDLKSGSTILTLFSSYLDTLSLGEHTLRFQYNEGRAAETTFTIIAKDNTEKPGTGTGTSKPDTGKADTVKTTAIPKTGDTSNTLLFVSLLALSCCAAASAKRKITRNK